MAGITINDIARELGIANSTVSRALRDDPRISERVKHEVKRAAARMGYVPNIAARSLRTGQSKMIGFLMRDIRDGLSSETIPAVEAACAEHGFGLLLCNADDDPGHERYYLRILQQRRVDGVLILTPTSPTADPYVPFGRSMPLVLVDIELQSNPVCSITVDHVMGGYLATQHLLELGHRRIACLTGPMHLSPCIRVAEGYKRAMAEAGLPAEEHLVVVSDKTGIADGYKGLLDTLKISPQPTAMATVSDVMAAGALDAARQHGLRVPEDFSIVGYDDIPMSALMSPPLTTIVQDKETLGRLAVELLSEEIAAGQHTHRQIILPPKLVVRSSSAAPPATTSALVAHPALPRLDGEPNL
jgi:LacI family transcriptional regulator